MDIQLISQKEAKLWGMPPEVRKSLNGAKKLQLKAEKEISKRQAKKQKFLDDIKKFSREFDARKVEMKKVKIGGEEFEIPKHMTIAGMVECWRDDSDSLEALAKDIVENNPHFAWNITSLWLSKQHQLLIDDPAYEEDEENQAVNIA